MGVQRFHYGLVFVWLLLAAGLLTAGSASAQSDSELKALNQRVSDLYRTGKYREAIPIAEEYVAAARMRHGEAQPVYATAISWFAQLLRATNRLAEAEPLFRGALAIDEKSLGPEHPDVV